MSDITRIGGSQIDATSALSRMHIRRPGLLTHRVGNQDIDLREYLDRRDEHTVDVRDFGAVGDLEFFDDILSITSGTNTLTVQQNALSQSDIGKGIYVFETDKGGYEPQWVNDSQVGLHTVISNISADGLTVTLRDNAPNTISSARTQFGIYTDDTAAIQSAIDHFQLKGLSGRILFPDNHSFAVSSTLKIYQSGIELVGHGHSILGAGVNTVAPNWSFHETSYKYGPEYNGFPQPRLVWVGEPGAIGDFKPILHIYTPLDPNDNFLLGDRSVNNSQGIANVKVHNIGFWGGPMKAGYDCPSAGILLEWVIYGEFTHINGRYFRDAVIATTPGLRQYRSDSAELNLPKVMDSGIQACKFEYVSLYGDATYTSQTMSETGGPDGTSSITISHRIRTFNGGSEFVEADIFGCTFLLCSSIYIEFADHNFFKQCNAIRFQGNNYGPQKFYSNKVWSGNWMGPNCWGNLMEACAPVDIVDTDENGQQYKNVAYANQATMHGDEDFGGFRVEDSVPSSPQCQGLWNWGDTEEDGNGNYLWGDANRSKLQGPEMVYQTEKGGMFNLTGLGFYNQTSFDSDAPQLTRDDGTFWLAWEGRQNYKITLVQNTEFYFSDPPRGDSWYVLELFDADKYTLTWPSGSSLVWKNDTGIEPAGLCDHEVFDIMFDGTNYNMYRRAKPSITGNVGNEAVWGDTYQTDIYNDTAAFTGNLSGRRIFTVYDGNQDASAIRGLQTMCRHDGSGVVSNLIAVNPFVSINGAGDVTDAIVNDAKVFWTGTGDITNSLVMFRATGTTPGGTCNAFFQFYAATSSPAAAGSNYAFYAQGGGNVFAVHSDTGNVSIGGTLSVTGALTGNSVRANTVTTGATSDSTCYVPIMEGTASPQAIKYNTALTYAANNGTLGAAYLKASNGIRNSSDTTIVNMSGGLFNIVTGYFYLGGIGVTASASELNILDASINPTITATNLNSLTDGSDVDNSLHYHDPVGLVRRSSTPYDFTATASTENLVPFDTTSRLDSPLTFSSNAFTVSTAGEYEISYKAQYKNQSGGADTFVFSIGVNGSPSAMTLTSATVGASSISQTDHNFSIVLALSASDTIDLRVNRGITGTIRLFAGSYLMVKRLT